MTVNDFIEQTVSKRVHIDLGLKQTKTVNSLSNKERKKKENARK